MASEVLPGRSSRRGFLRVALAGAAAPFGSGLLCSRLAAAGRPAAAGNFLVIVNLRGGNDGLNTVVPFRHANYARQRPTLALPATEVLSLDAGPYPNTVYGLHPSLQQVAALYAQGGAALVNLVGYPRPDLSHAESTDVWSRGVRELPPGASESGWIARFKDRYGPGAADVVGLGTGNLLDFQGGQQGPLLLNRLDGFGFAEDARFRANSRYRNQVVREIVEAQGDEGAVGQVKQSLALAYGQIDRMQSIRTNYTSNVTYPASSLAGRLREAAMLIQADLDSKILYAQTGGYDTHSGQAQRHAGLLGGVDAALGAFATDLQDMGAWARAVIVVISEFGRRNDENGSQGTDHGSSSCVLVLGGAVRGGVFGREHSEADLLEGHTPYDVDFRTIYKEVLADHLGVDTSEVFPEPPERTAPLGLIL